jgi:hypothetical protein
MATDAFGNNIGMVHGGGGVQDIASAFQAFNDGLGQYALTQSLNRAKDDIDQINQSQLDEDQKTDSLNAVAKDLTFKMSGLGAPASQIKSTVDSFKPPDPELVQNELQLFHTDPEAYKALKKSQLDQFTAEEKVKAQYAQKDPNGLGAFYKQQKIDQHFFDQSNKLRSAVNAFEVSGRKLPGKLAEGIRKVDDINHGLLANPSDLTGMTMFGAREGAATIDSVLSGGVGTQGGREHLVPPSVNNYIAGAKTFLSGHFESLNAPELAKQYKEFATRLGDVSRIQMAMGQKDTIRAAGAPYLKAYQNGQASQDYLNPIAGLIKLPDGERDQAYLDNKGQVRFQSDDQIDRLSQAVQQARKTGNVKLMDAVKDHPYYLQSIYERPALAKQIINFYERQDADRASGEAQRRGRRQEATTRANNTDVGSVGSRLNDAYRNNIQ